ncbi:MAG TPA: invasion associated locus B family protein [Allosphingosinicella sp.]|nr:invasion associated locus B family protein [Allosphingosinicella sp.]
MAILLVFGLGAATAALGQPQPLGIFGSWGAFAGDGRCYAIAQPAASAEAAQPFASVGYWPARHSGGQLHLRLSRAKRPGSAVLLRVDGRSFQLLGGGRDAWAADARADQEIQAAMRTGIDMVVETRSTEGLPVRDQYPLRGAATAMDAAAIACIRRR